MTSLRHVRINSDQRVETPSIMKKKKGLLNVKSKYRSNYLVSICKFLKNVHTCLVPIDMAYMRWRDVGSPGAKTSEGTRSDKVRVSAIGYLMRP